MWFLILFLFTFGVIIGSYLNVLVLRLPIGKKANGRSFCFGCKHQLSSLDLVPVLSYLFLKGKCRYCNQKISSRYLIVELVTGTLFALSAYILFPHSLYDIVFLVFALYVVCVCIVVFIIDLEHYLILDKVIFPSIFITALFKISLVVISSGSFFELLYKTLFALLVAPLIFYVLWLVSKGRWMGYGDVKFAIFMAIVLGFPVVTVGLFGSFIMGSIVSVILMIFYNKHLASRIPFGTFLAVSTILSLFYGEQILDWYLRIMLLK